MKTQKRFFRLLLLVALAFTFTNCTKDETPPPPEQIVDTDKDGIADASDKCPSEAGPANNQGCPLGEEGTGLTFDDVVKLGADPEPFPASRTEEEIGEPTSENEDQTRQSETGESITERFICTRRTVSVRDGNGEFPLFNTSADVIYPGNILQGKTLQAATPSPIVVKRAGGTISYDLNNGNLQSSFDVEEVKKSSVQEAMNNIISNSGDVVPANIDLEIIQIESESQLALEIGFDVETLVTKTSGNLSFSQDKSYNRTLVKLNQSYYTMSFDLPTSLDQIFDASVKPDDLATYVQADNPATFISSVTYGRVFYMLIESTSSRTEMQSKLDLAYDGVAAQVEGSIEASYIQELNDLKIKVMAYGGDAAGSISLAGEQSISDIADRIAQSTDVRAGLPISYVVRSVERPDQIVGVQLATEYDIVNCELKGVLPPQAYLSLVDLFKDDADGGGIGAMTNVTGNEILVFNKTGDKYAWFNGNSGEIKGVYGIKDANSPLGVVPLENVGAVLIGGEATMHLIDKTGLYLAKYNWAFDGVDFSGDNPPIQFGIYYTGGNGGSDQVFLMNTEYGQYDNFQFGQEGIDAGLSLRGVDGLRFTLFAKPGNEFQNLSVYDSTDIFGNFTRIIEHTNPGNTRDWIYNSGNSIPFEKVGAACYISIGGEEYYLFVNDTGDELASGTLTVFSGQNLPTAQFDAPWVIN
ncbi:thiol-activated cytolysin family protein [Maribacter halichondriae]|uniref:thiol-activated cytolysin family protein n=1 Tax=Maribacter halichondriae TaxID=2980554 RepID=UPI00235923E7|nr:thiol-activated cytolysin family protein [Maribacter sp. Hal144]